MPIPCALLYLARWVLLGFVLSLAAAIASPMVNPRAMELICAGAGLMKFVQQAGDDANAPASLTLDCPLCANLGAPPPWLAIAAAVVFHPAYALGPAKGAPRASLPRDPWQARAPPLTPELLFL